MGVVRELDAWLGGGGGGGVVWWELGLDEGMGGSEEKDAAMEMIFKEGGTDCRSRTSGGRNVGYESGTNVAAWTD